VEAAAAKWGQVAWKQGQAGRGVGVIGPNHAFGLGSSLAVAQAANAAARIQVEHRSWGAAARLARQEHAQNPRQAVELGLKKAACETAIGRKLRK